MEKFETERRYCNLRMKCPNCGHWNRTPVNKVFIEQPTSETKVKAYIPMYKPLEVTRCRKCGKVVAEPDELIRITARAKQLE